MASYTVEIDDTLLAIAALYGVDEATVQAGLDLQASVLVGDPYEQLRAERQEESRRLGEDLGTVNGMTPAELLAWKQAQAGS